VYQYFFRIYTLELMVDIDAIKRRFESLLPTVDERLRRLIAAAESLAIDYPVRILTEPRLPVALLRFQGLPSFRLRAIRFAMSVSTLTGRR